MPDPVGATGSIPSVLWSEAAALTQLDPESLIVYCQAQLSGIDDQVAALTREQELAVARKQAVQSASNACAAYSNGDADAAALTTAFEEAIQSLPEGDTTRVELEAYAAQLGLVQPTEAEIEAAVNEAQAEVLARYVEQTEGSSTVPGLVSDLRDSVGANLLNANLAEAEASVRARMTAQQPSKAMCDAVRQQLDTLADGIGANAEINMIHLQSLVSTRQTMVGLITNLMAKIQSGEKAIVDNIR